MKPLRKQRSKPQVSAVFFKRLYLELKKQRFYREIYLETLVII
jgi:hypothetical protein